MTLSKINSNLTIENLKTRPESLYFDRKKGKISLQDLANTIASFANANGGIIALGITDDGQVEGLNKYGIDKINDFQKVVTNYLKTVPIYKTELINVENSDSKEDVIILYHIEASLNLIIRNNKDEVYLRQGDSSIKLNSEQTRSLEYDRQEKNFETEVVFDSYIEDIDTEILEIYKEKIGTNLSHEDILKARGFLVKRNNEYHLTKAGILLFGNNPTRFLPSARVRVVKFDGTEFQVGEHLNIVKDRTFDKCLYKTIMETKEFISTQLREFTHLNKNGVFETIPEYPEFAWVEGLINAVCHRDYSNSGEHIIIKIFDDHLEIQSPGKLGGFITLDNMINNRYSRNPQIARTLVEFGVVRELNEGIKRIYSSMKDFFLKQPIYSEPNHNSVLLILDNNIAIRANRKQEKLKKENNIKDKWDELSYAEQQILQTIYDKGSITSEETAKIINRGKTTAVKLLNNLVEKNLIIWDGTAKFDKNGKYIMK